MSITRQDLEQDRLRNALINTPIAGSFLSEETLEASWRGALASLPPHTDGIWLFGYGSLIWNPMVLFTQRRRATLHGYHRGFYLYSNINRGTVDKPGLVLGLDRGGCCNGVAFWIPAANIETELRMLWRREMLTGAYLPRWLSIRLPATDINPPHQVRALAFVMNRHHAGYAGRLSDAIIISHLRDATGLYGPARDYLQHTLEGLLKEGLNDSYLARLWTQLQNEPR
ncbi:gamma-glutamylcyclotransferase [Glaciimonas immobilis]|uniref:glutathione-specific gamma-glutamylcyclotransferase n=1 Tax=Glaciimonas immobilis TaxID=728004 RepID=A0A840RZW9_9BURK|nr:gamma-glutamylcyclotransferase [Glaciimonas immobilis]KAF3996640.1 gamma-glutamylcyclotransferase [Glaciimonas immobilis]MBB5202648.1 cation transport protein ChaC [Glaciimonas immobilis]